MNTGFSEASLALRRFDDFEECLLEDVKWGGYGTRICLVFDVVRDANRKIRADLDVPWHVECDLVGVVSIDLKNPLSSVVLDNPDDVDWGTSEVAYVRLVECQLADRPGVEVLVSWGAGRTMSVTAASVSMRDTWSSS